MTKFAYKSFIFKTNDEIGRVRDDLGQAIEKKLNECGDLGYDTDMISNEGDFLIVVMRKEIKISCPSRKRLKKPILDNNY